MYLCLPKSYFDYFELEAEDTSKEGYGTLPGIVKTKWK